MSSAVEETAAVRTASKMSSAVWQAVGAMALVIACSAAKSTGTSRTSREVAAAASPRPAIAQICSPSSCVAAGPAAAAAAAAAAALAPCAATSIGGSETSLFHSFETRPLDLAASDSGG